MGNWYSSAPCSAEHNENKIEPTIPKIDYKELVENRKASESEKYLKAMFVSGFCILTNTGVSKEVQDGVWQLMPEFFEKTSRENKLSAKTGEINGHYGYDDNENLAKGMDKGTEEVGTRNVEDEKTDRSTKDAKEMLTVRIGTKTNPYKFVYPEEPKGLKEATEMYIREMERVTKGLLEVTMELVGSKFEEKGYMDNHMGCLRMNYYPHQDHEHQPEPGSIRCAEHTDYGPITILKPDVVGGLMAYIQGKWIDVKPDGPYDFVINYGDTMMRWTNNKILATLHKVVNPDKVEGEGLMKKENNARRSLAWFFNCNGDALIKTLPSCVSDDSPDLYKGNSITQEKLVVMKHMGSKVIE